MVISDDLWEARFGRSADAIGSTLRLKGEPFTVIGVAPRDFSGAFRGLRAQVWVPLSARSTLTGVDASQRGNRSFAVLGRMREDATVETVQSRLDVVASRLHAAYPEQWTDVNERPRVFTALSEAEARVPPQERGPILSMMTLLMGAVLTVLLIACSNVANLMLSRASTRRGEMGIRLALGATRGRIVRHLLAESLVLAALGGVAGVLLAVGIAEVGRSQALAAGIPAVLDIAIDLRVLGFAALITLLTGVLFGLAPALQASRALAPTMKEGGSGRIRLRIRHALVVFQVASSLVLLVAGGLFMRSLGAARGMDSGFEVDNVVLARFELGPEGYTDEQSSAFYDDLLERAPGLPGTTAVALTETVPLGMGWSRRNISVEGYEPEAGEEMEFMYNGVTPGYFATMGIEPRLGRAFTDADRADAPPVAIVTEAFARRFWPGESPLGKRVGFYGREGPLAEVVGVVPDAKYRSLAEDPQPYFYYPYLQRPSPHMALLVRSAADPELVTDALRDVVQDVAPTLPRPSVQTFRQHMSAAALPQRIAAALLGALGASRSRSPRSACTASWPSASRSGLASSESAWPSAPWPATFAASCSAGLSVWS